MEENIARGISHCMEGQCYCSQKGLKTATSVYFPIFLEENKHNPMHLFDTEAKLTRYKALTSSDVSKQHSSSGFMNFFTCKNNTIKG